MRILPLQILAWGLVLALLPSPSQAAHPFYQRLLREGSAALAQEDFAEAQRLLRLANFGLLSEPERLAEGLVQLAIAEARGGQQEGFRETFGRILEIEEGFSAYSKAALDPGLEARFEGLLAARVPAQTLRSVPAFRPLARRMELERIQGLPKDQRREALEELLAQDPREAAPALRLAEIEIEAGDGISAANTLQGVLAAAPEHPEANCLLGLAHHTAGRCDLAAPLLAGCAETPSTEPLAAALLECYLSLEQWASATELMATLSPDIASRRQIARLGRRAAKEHRRQLKLQGTEELPSAEGEPVEQNPGEIQEASGNPGAVPSENPGTRMPSPELPEKTTEPDREDVPTARTAPEPPPSPGVAPPRSPPPRSQSAGPQPAPEAAAPQILPREAQRRLDEARDLLSKARLASDLTEAFDLAKSVADRYPQARAAQHLVGEIAYRASRWQESATYFRRGGDPGEERPTLLFFMAVSYFENGDLEDSRRILRRVLPKLQRTEFVNDYVTKILSNAP